MSLKVFVSSEMDSEDDIERRNYANKAISEAGHIPVMFEDFAGRPFEQYEKSAIDPCIEEVKNSDLFVFIVDDNISKGMKAEYSTAKEYLGTNKIFYYFTKNNQKSSEVEYLWSETKKEGLLKEFQSNNDLQRLITKSFAHYLKDKIKKGPEIIFEEDMEINAGYEKHLRWWFEKGDNIIVTVVADGDIYAEFMIRKEYVKRKDGADEGMFDFEFGTDRSTYTVEGEIEESDDYYLVLRVSSWGDDKNVNVRIIKKHS